MTHSKYDSREKTAIRELVEITSRCVVHHRLHLLVCLFALKSLKVYPKATNYHVCRQLRHLERTTSLAPDGCDRRFNTSKILLQLSQLVKFKHIFRGIFVYV